MSGRVHRAEQRRAARLEAAHHNQWMGTVIAWAPTNDVDNPECRRAMTGSHDGLIELMGDHRTGPVTWHFYDPPAGEQVLDRMEAESLYNELTEVYAECRELLRTWGGVLIIATAPGRRPEPEGP